MGGIRGRLKGRGLRGGMFPSCRGFWEGRGLLQCSGGGCCLRERVGMCSLLADRGAKL